MYIYTYNMNAIFENIGNLKIINRYIKNFVHAVKQ